MGENLKQVRGRYAAGTARANPPRGEWDGVVLRAILLPISGAAERRGRRGGWIGPPCGPLPVTGPVVIIGTVPEEPRPSPNESDFEANRDQRFMRRALEEAERAYARGEVPVGALVVRGEQILGIAHNERETTQDPTAHAELLALRRASASAGSWRLTDCTLYTTLEPCPMCAGALHAARVSRLVYAAPDPKAGAAGTLYDLPADLRLNHTYPYTRGILQSEAVALLQTFFRQRRRKQ